MTSNRASHLITILICLAGLLLQMAQSSVAFADAAGVISDRECYGCHMSEKRTYLQSPHGLVFSEQRDGSRGCQTCHGPGAAHMELAEEDKPSGPWKIESFQKPAVKKRGESAAARDRSCLACHSHRPHGNGCPECHVVHKVRESKQQ